VAAADEYIKQVHSHWPKAKIVVVLPTSATPDVAANYSAVAEGLRRTAEGVGAYVIDPVAQRWYRGVNANGLLWRDGTHLNSAGDAYYAGKIVENLKQMFDDKPKLLVVGDSFAGGVGDPNIVTYPDLVAEKMGWSVAVDAQGATGFLHGIDNLSPPQVPFIDRLDGDAATYHPDYVLIDGGRNDLGEPPEPAVAAADEYIKQVRSVWPNAKMIIVLPALATSKVDYVAVAEGLHRTAERVGAYVIDPVAQHWYRDIDVKRLLWRDNVNLNDAGEAYYADKIVENLRHLGFGA
jgi:lysophospholipase L1-like esterase